MMTRKEKIDRINKQKRILKQQYEANYMDLQRELADLIEGCDCPEEERITFEDFDPHKGYKTIKYCKICGKEF